MKENKHKLVEKTLLKNHSHYVLITCDEGVEKGTMEVKMSYSGDDPVLASYLLHGAQAYIDEEVAEEAVE